MISAATGSAHHRPKTALRARPESVVADRYPARKRLVAIGDEGTDVERLSGVAVTTVSLGAMLWLARANAGCPRDSPQGALA